MEIKKIALFGAGAIGAYFIWGLAETMGEDFYVIASGERKKKLEKGICINGNIYHVNVKTPEQADTPDLLLIGAKQDALDGMLADIKKIVGKDTMVLSLLNGVTSEEIIAREVGEEHLMYSVMRIASVRKENDIVFSPERTAGLFFGEGENIPLTSRAQTILDFFENTRIRATYVERMLTDLWMKYASNISQNLPQAILGVGFGAYKSSEHVDFIAQKLWEEVALVAEKKGVQLPQKRMLFNGCKKTARFSTLQDLDAGRHTEIDMFAGEVVRMAAQYGIETPYCEYTYHLIKALEEKNDGRFSF